MKPPSITIEIDCDSIDVANSKLHYLSERIAKVHTQLLDLGEGSEISEHLDRLEGIVGLQTIVPWASDPDRYDDPNGVTREVHVKMIEQLRAELAKERRAHLATQVQYDAACKRMVGLENANLSMQEQILILQTELDELRGSRELADELGADLEKLHLTATNSTLQLDCPYCDGIGKWQHRPWKEITDAPTTP